MIFKSDIFLEYALFVIKINQPHRLTTKWEGKSQRETDTRKDKVLILTHRDMSKPKIFLLRAENDFSLSTTTTCMPDNRECITIGRWMEI